MKILLLILIPVLSLVCNLKSKTQGEKVENHEEMKSKDNLLVSEKDMPSAIIRGTSSYSFLDSVLKKHELSLEQIKKNTTLDSLYYTGRFTDAIFTGDTVIPLYDSFKAAIIECDERRNCIYKFLLIFDSAGSRNFDHKKIYSECDRDESTDYWSTDYKFINDSSFHIIESYIPKNSDKILERRKTKWQINQKGIIVEVM